MSLGDRRRPVGKSRKKSGRKRSGETERRPQAVEGRTPQGGRAGYAGADATWSRDRLSRHHIISASRLADATHTLEEADPGDLPPEERWRYRAYVTAAVLSSAAYLEASINELYMEIQKLSQEGEPPLRRELTMLLGVWPRIVRAPVLQKYQLALSVTDADPYHEGHPPFLDADSLVHLRDALLSYDADWEDSRGRHQVLEQRLRDNFPASPLVSSRRPWFPDRCLGAGCARWAVRTVQLFTNDFYQRMALPARPMVGQE